MGERKIENYLLNKKTVKKELSKILDDPLSCSIFAVFLERKGLKQ